jgi:hypothetical protein
MTVVSQSQLDEKLASGWHLTLEQAIDAAGESASRHLKNRKVRQKIVRVAKPPVERRASIKRVAAAKAVPEAPSVIVPDDDAAPTRAELEAKATELGIKFDGRTKYKKLLAKINEALTQPEEA